MITVQGEQSDPRMVLLRLEDVGPGGQYETEESLGKLRAVLDNLNKKHVRYQIGVIPRWINYLPDKTVYNRQLDQLNDPYIQAFNRILRSAVQSGATIGMHGYTHQIGDVRREDGQQESGVGNEFNAADMPETLTPEFAKTRIEEGLNVFRAAGLRPEFWETPHYHETAEQSSVFAHYFGLQYENVVENANQPYAQYRSERLKTSLNLPNAGLGAVYVPTPFSYIPYNKDEKLIVNQLGRKKLPSFFYHPFLEFKTLIPVLDEKGMPVIQDGLPLYKYPDKDKSNLQKLIASLYEKEYSFYSIHDYVPFTPSHSTMLSSGRAFDVQFGDVTGGRQADSVAWNSASGNVIVRQANYRGYRCDEQPDPEVWLNRPRGKGDFFTLLDDNQDGRKDLWIVRSSGKIEAYHSTGTYFEYYRSWNVKLAGEWAEIYPLRLPNGDWMIAGTSLDSKQLYGLYLHDGQVRPATPFVMKSPSLRRMQTRKPQPDGPETLWINRPNSDTGMNLEFNPKTMKWYLTKETLNLTTDMGVLQFGDFNKDGREDALLWNEAEQSFLVFLKQENGVYKPLPKFGPWGKSDSRLIVADFDGSGTADIGLIGADGRLDLALSYLIPD